MAHIALWNFSPQFIVSYVPLIINESQQLSMFPDSKHFIDLVDCPTWVPEIKVADPYLADEDLQDNSFLQDSLVPVPQTSQPSLLGRDHLSCVPVQADVTPTKAETSSIVPFFVNAVKFASLRNQFYRQRQFDTTELHIARMPCGPTVSYPSSMPGHFI